METETKWDQPVNWCKVALWALLVALAIGLCGIIQTRIKWQGSSLDDWCVDPVSTGHEMVKCR